MAKWGFLGAALGTAAAIAAAPFTGGASLGLLVAGGALAGATIGSQIDASKAAKQSNKLANAQLEDSRAAQGRLKEEKTKVDAQARREKSKIDAGIARSLRRKYKKQSGFLSDQNANQTETLG